jgi:hypothetical protein
MVKSLLSVVVLKPHEPKLRSSGEGHGNHEMARLFRARETIQGLLMMTLVLDPTL